MGAADPTYPLYPIACILASVMLFLVLATSFIRRSWNLGVLFLCIWVLSENITNAVSAIIWSDNADLKAYVYCDIASHLGIIAYVVKPMATLIITRRLYLIANHHSVTELQSKSAKRWDLAVEWTLGLIIPLLVAGPIYYVSQDGRFTIIEGFGCLNATETSIVEILTLQSWSVIPPLISVTYYYPKVIRTYYRQRKDIDSFLRSNPSVSYTSYSRILILSSIDILITLPIGISNIVLDATGASSLGLLPFYPGWTNTHADWEPFVTAYNDLQAAGTASLAQTYFASWSSPVLAFAIFGLFGITTEARASYCRIICTVGGCFGWKPSPHARNGRESLGEMEFGARPTQHTSGFDLEIGYVRHALLWEASLTSSSRSFAPSFIDTDADAEKQRVGHTLGGRAAREETGMETSLEADEETRHESTGDSFSQ
ncbi:STE3-domain-containing protein [Peniophora sp. CONT]|nr:STE3-domain-containing protein [Peniophora sp. CONT]